MPPLTQLHNTMFCQRQMFATGLFELKVKKIVFHIFLGPKGLTSDLKNTDSGFCKFFWKIYLRFVILFVIP